MPDVVVVAALAGCVAHEEGWVAASAELQAHGVHAFRNAEDAVRQIVMLRDAQAAPVGELTLETREHTRTLTLELGSVVWSQTVRPEQREIELRVGDRRATLALDDASGEAAALLRQAQPYVELGRIIGVEANLNAPMLPVAPPANAGAPPAPAAAPATDGGGFALCCSTVPVVGNGWAWYWERDTRKRACERASDNTELSCKLASAGLACCDRAASCTSCIDWGTGYYCSTVGYLQYRC